MADVHTNYFKNLNDLKNTGIPHFKRRCKRCKKLKIIPGVRKICQECIEEETKDLNNFTKTK